MRLQGERAGWGWCVLAVAWIAGMPVGASASEAEESSQVEKRQIEKRSGGAVVKLGWGGFEVRNRKKTFTFELGGRLLIDSAFHHDDAEEIRDRSEIRQARLSLKATAGKRWDFKAQLEASGDDVSYRDLYARLALSRALSVTFGSFKEPFSLEEQISSGKITFMERALPVDAFAPSRAVGVGVHRNLERGSLAAGLFGESISGSNSLRGDQGFGLPARATWAPVLGDRRAVHLGIAGEYREPRDGERLRFSADPESSVSPFKLLRTRRIKNIRDTTRYGLELAAVLGRLSFQAEYIRTDLRRTGRGTASLEGGYAYVSWFVTGEARPYKVSEGSFGGVKPKGKHGAFELAFRASYLDLDDGDIRGGRENNLTLGVNWYARHAVRLMANYVIIDSVRRGDRDDPRIFLFRVQIAF